MCRTAVVRLCDAEPEVKVTIRTPARAEEPAEPDVSPVCVMQFEQVKKSAAMFINLWMMGGCGGSDGWRGLGDGVAEHAPTGTRAADEQYAGGKGLRTESVGDAAEQDAFVAVCLAEQRGRLGRVLSSDRRELHRCCRRDHRLDDQRVVRPGSQTSPSFWIRIFSTQRVPADDDERGRRRWRAAAWRATMLTTRTR